LTFIGAGDEKPVDYLTPVTPGNGQAFRAGLLDGDWIDEESQTSAAMTE
jgi:hypothetical protein